MAAPQQTITNDNPILFTVQSNSIIPVTNGTLNLGSPTQMYNNVYANNLVGVPVIGGLSPSLPVKTDAKSQLTSSQIDLTTDVKGVLPTANGGLSTIAQTIAGPKTFTDNAVIGNVLIGDVGLPGSEAGFINSNIASGQDTKFALVQKTSGETIINCPLGQVIYLSSGNVPAVQVGTGTVNVAGFVAATGTVTGSNLSGTNTGDLTLTTVGSTPTSNGASLVGQQLQLQPADATHSGILSTTSQSIAGDKDFKGTTTLSALTASLPLKTNVSKQIIAAQIDLKTEVTGVLPAANGGSTGTNTGDLTLTTVGSSPNANGASLVGQQLQLQPANATNAGVISTTTQTIAGNKTLSGNTTMSSSSNGALAINSGGNIQINRTGNWGGIQLAPQTNNNEAGLSFWDNAAGFNGTSGDGTYISRNIGGVSSNSLMVYSKFRGGWVAQFHDDGTFRVNDNYILAPQGIKFNCDISMCQSAGITLTASSNNKITWDTPVRNQGITYSGGDFKLPIVGYYLVNWTACLDTAPTVEMSMQVIQSTASGRQNGNTVFSSIKGYATLTTIIRCTAVNETLYCNIYKAPAATSNISGGTTFNFITISLLQNLT